MVAFGSSLDQAGPLAASSRDLLELLDVVSGFDPRDATSLEKCDAAVNEPGRVRRDFDSAQAAFDAAGSQPLKGLRIGAGQGLAIGEAEVLVSMYSGLLPGRSLTELRLRGLALDLQQGEDGRWSVRGLPQSTNGGDPLDALRRLGELQVVEGRLGVRAPGLGIDTTLPRIDLRLRVNGDRLRVGVRLAGRRSG
ncbi:hypothetical protein G6F31_016667 [Rhizopus arrhizus]|nr:hypothetical protein G6F31_016667 [Rhizopus arrhizus]